MRLFRNRDDDIAVAELRSMVAAIDRSQAVIQFDLDGTVREANANFLSVLGYALDDIVGRHHRMFVDPAEVDSPAYADFWRRLNAGEFVSDKFVRYGQDGRRVVIEASYNPVFDATGRVYKVVKFAIDVTAVEEERERRLAAEHQAAAIQTAVVQGTARGLSAMAAGDLAYRIEDAFPGDYAALRDNFNAAMAALARTFATLAEAARLLKDQLDARAQDRIVKENQELDRVAEARMKGYEGEDCRECGNFTLVRNGTCLKCDTCGGTSGCS